MFPAKFAVFLPISDSAGLILFSPQGKALPVHRFSFIQLFHQTNKTGSRRQIRICRRLPVLPQSVLSDPQVCAAFLMPTLPADRAQRALGCAAAQEDESILRRRPVLCSILPPGKRPTFDGLQSWRRSRSRQRRYTVRTGCRQAAGCHFPPLPAQTCRR